MVGLPEDECWLLLPGGEGWQHPSCHVLGCIDCLHDVLVEGTVLAEIHAEAFYLWVRFYFLSPAVYTLVASLCLVLSVSQHLEFIIIKCHVVCGCPSVHSVEVFL